MTLPWLLIVSALLRWHPEVPQDAPPKQEVRQKLDDILAGRDYGREPGGPTVGERLWERVKKLFEGLSGLDGWVQNVITAVCLVILAAIFVHFLVLLYRSTRNRRLEGEAIAKARGADPRELLAQARAAGDVAAALSLYVRAALAGLDRRGVLRLADTSTVREVRALLSGRTEAQPFESLLSHYEPGVFGRKPVARDAVAECDRAVVTLIGAA